MNQGPQSPQDPQSPLIPFDEEIIDNLVPDDSRNYFAIMILSALMLCWPVWAVKYVPLVDYPNHLGRMNILYEYSTNPIYQNTYSRSLDPLPNLGMDLIVPALINLADANTAGKLFLTFAVLLFCFGCHTVGVSLHGRPSWLTIPCCFFFYNSTLFYGFVNYIFGCAMFLITLAWWLRHRQSQKLNTWLITTLLVLACYLSHLSAYVFLSCAIVSMSLYDLLTTRQIRRGVSYGLIALIPPVVLFVLYAKTTETKHIYWNGVYKKAIALLSLFLSYDFRLDLIVVALVIALIIFVTWHTRRVSSNRSALVAALMMLLGFVVAPEGLFQVNGIDARFVLPAAILLLLSLRVQLGNRVGKVAMAAILLIFGMRLVSVSRVWHQLDTEIGVQVAMFDSFPEGSRVYPIIFLPAASQPRKLERPFMHVIHYSTINHHTFSPSLFTIKGQQPIGLKKEAVYFHEYHDQQPSAESVNWRAIFDSYDYIWCYGISEQYDSLLRKETELIDNRGRYKIFKVHAK